MNSFNFSCIQAEKELNSSALIYNQIWRIGDVARFLKCSIGHVYNLTSREKIPFRKRGGMLFFFPSEILNWANEGD